MKKTIISIAILLSTFILFSCEVSNHAAYTAKEQIDYINENLFFEDEHIKLGVVYPELFGRNKEDEIFTGMDESSGIYLKYDKEKYDLSTPFDDLSYEEQLNVSLWQVVIGSNNSSMKYNNIITGLYSRVNNFSLFNEGLNGSMNNIIEPLIKRGFVQERNKYLLDKKTNENVILSFGAIQISIHSIEDKIDYISIGIIYTQLTTDNLSQTALKGYELNTENVVKYAFPFDAEDFKARIIFVIDVYTGKRSVSYNFRDDGLFITKQTYDSIHSEDEEKNRKIQIKNTVYFYADAEFKEIIPYEKYNDEKYISSFKEIYLVRYQFNTKIVYIDGKQNSVIETNGVKTEYQYLIDLIFGDPNYIK